MKLIDNILDLIFPPTCEFCGKVGTYLCDNCRSIIEEYIINSIKKDKLFIFKYEGTIRELIIKYKFREKSYLSKLFSEILLKNKKICKIIKSYDIIISVPLSRRRKLERGYNQSYLILKEMSKKMEFNLKNNILKKVKDIKPQSEKGYKQRKEDIKGAYIVENATQILGKRVLLFDDVYTTGSTTMECKKELLKAGAKEVIIFALAKD